MSAHLPFNLQVKVKQADSNCTLSCRREELKEAVTSSDKAQELLLKYSLEALGESLLAYVTKARAALGPPLLKVRLPLFCNQLCPLQNAVTLFARHLQVGADMTLWAWQVLETDVATGRYMPYMTGTTAHIRGGSYNDMSQ